VEPGGGVGLEVADDGGEGGVLADLAVKVDVVGDAADGEGDAAEVFHRAAEVLVDAGADVGVEPGLAVGGGVPTRGRNRATCVDCTLAFRTPACYDEPCSRLSATFGRRNKQRGYRHG